jgi:hypothetical protein
MNKYLASVIILLSFASPAFAAGGAFSLSASSTTVSVGDTFTLRVGASSGGVQVNTVGADLSYPASLVAASSVSGPSIITLYVAKGITDPGRISIQGGILPQQILSDSAIGTVTFRAVAQGMAVISTASSSGIYANDGKGTDILTSRGSISVVIGPKKTTPPVVQPPVNQPVNVNEPLLNNNVQPPFIPESAVGSEQQPCSQNWRYPAAVGAGAAIIIIIALFFIGRAIYGHFFQKRKPFTE